MLSFFLKRLGMSVLLLFIVSVATFLLISLSPGDAAYTLLGSYATPDALAVVRAQLHLNDPLPVQYWSWLTGILHGDLGSSLLTGQPVADALAARIGPTLAILIGTMLVTIVVGVGLGVLSALRGGAVARLVDALGLLGMAIPGFVVALVLIYLFAVKVRVFPVGGYTPISDGLGPWALGLVLPVVALAVGSVGILAKQTRSSMLEALSGEFIRTLSANGFSRRSVVYKHALRSAAVPVLAVTGLTVVGVLGGSVLIEQVFGIAGLGGLAVQATVQKDLPVVQATAVIFALIVVVVNLVLDVLYVMINPKVSAQ